MENDDQQVGRFLSRREALKLLGLAGVAWVVGCTPDAPETVAPTAAGTQVTPAGETVAVPACVVRPELTEGPYFVDEELNRSDIRSDPSDNSVQEGAQLDLTIRVAQISAQACLPLAGAQVDIWHCDARGVYSDVNDANFGSTRGQKFLRGYQLTDSEGVVRFTTIYPGWYPGRAVHIHFKIRTPALNQSYDFTSQFFFDEALSAQVYSQSPYDAKGTNGMLSNADDNIYGQSGGQTLLTVVENGAGYAAAFDIGLEL